LTRQSIHFAKSLLAKKMDARVKPGHDDRGNPLTPAGGAFIARSGSVCRLWSQSQSLRMFHAAVMIAKGLLPQS